MKKRQMRVMTTRNPPRTRSIESLEARALLAGDLGHAMFQLAVDAGSGSPVETAIVKPLDLTEGLSNGVQRVVFSPASRGGFDPGSHDAGPRISDAQRDNLATLRSDLTAIRESSEVTQEQIDQLVASIAAVVDGATPPSQESVAKLREDLSAAVKDQQLSPIEVKQLQDDLAEVLASAGVPVEELEAVHDNLQVIVDASGVDEEDLQTITADVVAIVEEFRNRTPLVSEAQQENLQTLATDLRTIADHTEVTPALAEEIRDDVRTLVADATRPDRALVVQLRRDLHTVQRDGVVTEEEKELIATDLEAVLQSANLSQEHWAELWADIDATGLTRSDVETVVKDLVAIREEFRVNHPGLPAVSRPRVVGRRST